MKINKISRGISNPYDNKYVPLELNYSIQKKQYDDKKVTEWNIDGLSDYQILQVISNMFTFAQTVRTKNNKEPKQIYLAIITRIFWAIERMVGMGYRPKRSTLFSRFYMKFGYQQVQIQKKIGKKLLLMFHLGIMNGISCLWA